MDTREKELKELLTNQDFDHHSADERRLEHWKLLAESYAQTENGIAVLSDFQNNTCYIYSGKLGEHIGLPREAVKTDSAFEEEIFNLVPPEELLERHVLELRFFQLQHTLPPAERSHYNMICPIHFRTGASKNIPVLHRSYYLENSPQGSICLGLCLYTPFMETGQTLGGQIINNCTGQAILAEVYTHLDHQLLSMREIEVLSLLAKGQSSKQIAHALCLSVNTVYRHRQNILSALQVNNTAAAVEIGLRLHLID